MVEQEADVVGKRVAVERVEQSKQRVLRRGIGGVEMSRAEQAVGARAWCRGSRDAPEIAHDGDRGTGFSVDCAGKGGRFERKAAAGELGLSMLRR